MAQTAEWPPITSENRPWTRWWWMGSALTESEITCSLERFRDAGFGGVEISPIYGPRGFEERFEPFLSERWMELFAHALTDADRLALGVDLIAGTGWPFGGPWVADADAARSAWVERLGVDGNAVSRRNPAASLLAEKTLPSIARRYALFAAPTGQQVKRAAPGGEGNVLNPFDAGAVRRYLAAFDKAFASLPKGLRPRCFFNDSWEVFGANATPDILAEFTRRRGYDLATELPALAGFGGSGVRQVRSDYRETIHELALESFLETFGSWAREVHGAKMRNQAHGSPGNLLDLYAAADIPETEVFGPPRLAHGGLKSYRELPPDFGTEEEALVCRMASSAAHVSGRPLCSSESFTWLGEHGHVTLEQMKAEVDTLFTLGINHLFFHGTPFSPEDVPWPGWMFYATTHCAPTNPFWRDLPALNEYIARCQSHLQAGRPDNDILLYFPFYDLIAMEQGTQDLLHFLTVGRTATWLRGNLPDFTATANLLAKRGWSFDLVSDKQLRERIEIAANGNLTTTGGAKYRTLLIAGCTRMPPETLERITELARSGASVLALGKLPSDIPGLPQTLESYQRIRAAKAALMGAPTFASGDDIEALLTDAGIARESIADLGIEFVRRRTEAETTYFLANPGIADVAAWVPLAHASNAALIWDPMTARAGLAEIRTHDDRSEIFLDLPAGASRIIRTVAEIPASTIPWRSWKSDGPTVNLSRDWRVEFIDGGPTLPEARSILGLSDWTTWQAADSEALRAFSGTARYTRTFDFAAGTTAPNACAIDLGRVCHSAHVTLNGHDLGAVFSRPWRVTFPPELLQPTANVLTIDVTNLMANRLAALERAQGAAWRPFLMVNIHYKPFDAASWKAVPSGLIGPVRLLSLVDDSLAAGNTADGNLKPGLNTS